MSAESPILLINPFIWDFTAFDLWAKPLGLLSLASTLRAEGYPVRLIDCLDPHFAGAGNLSALPPRKIYGTGKYFRQKLLKPTVLADVPRYFYRYGISPALFSEALKAVPTPKAVLITSAMTYWYRGVQETVSLVRSALPGIPVILGGLYASLMPQHARAAMAPDYLITGPGEGAILKLLGELTGREEGKASDGGDPGLVPFPAFDLYPILDYVCLMTSRGCPYACPYCASRFLQSRFRQRPVDQVVEEIQHWHDSRAVMDFAFYDDALLIQFEKHLGPILEALLKRNLSLRFHTPNAVHVREINADRAALLYRAGFKTLRLGLETTNWERQEAWGGKMDQADLARAVAALNRAGFGKNELEVYLLCGLPGQPLSEILQTIQEVKGMGLRPRLAEYSPLPHTPLWEEACRVSRFPLAEEPLFHNNSLWPCLDPFSWETVQSLKDVVRP
jgi:radical SAM superfamily enzyme YgiQ (UPF0313 family)